MLNLNKEEVIFLINRLNGKIKSYDNWLMNIPTFYAGIPKHREVLNKLEIAKGIMKKLADRIAREA